MKFIYNTKWDDFISNESLHRRAKLQPINDRLNDLRTKLIDKMKFKYIDEIHNIFNKYSEYLLEEAPYKEPKTTVKELYTKFQSKELISD